MGFNSGFKGLTNKTANSPPYLSSRRVSLYTAQQAYSRLDPKLCQAGVPFT